MSQKHRSPEPDETGSVSLTKKQVADKVRRRETLADHDMRGLDLSCLCFDGMDLTRAKLAHSDLSHATFRRANLAWASLWGADLTEADFEGACLEDADLDQARLAGASFRGARIRRTLFPLAEVSLEEVQTSVRTGQKIVEHEPDDDG
jgi:uncharacterized protein YjbI with pentapeptide repeats